MKYTKIREKLKPHLLKSATIKQIEQHTALVRGNRVVCGLPECPKCRFSPHLFKPHERKPRQFYVIVDQWVITVMGLLMRWKCPDCKKTATDYPDFSLPYKRYTVPTVLDYCERYVTDSTNSYRQLVNECPLVYQPRSDSEVPYAQMMEHSTIYRWVTTLGGYSKIVRTATDLINQADPNTTIHRDMANLSIASKKYTSEKRKKRLVECFQLIVTDKVYHWVFGVSIFPNLATNCAFS